MDRIEVIQRALELENKNRDDPNWDGFEWHEVGAYPQTLNSLVVEGVLKTTYRSRQYKHYRVADDIEVVLAALGIAPEQEIELPKDLFDIIEGCDSAKRLLKMALSAPRPVHTLLHGPYATAKTLFLSELGRLPNSRYALGGTTSRAGVVDYVLQSRPRYLILDELDKMDARDYSALLSLMETGTVSRLKHKATELERLVCWVFAGANRIERLPGELRSRFLKVEMTEYSDPEFKRVVVSVLMKREGIDAELANYIANRLVGRTKDVRDAVRIARMAPSVSEVDELVRSIF